jgi:NodT family efflux transporter outer membrane factor (OMF) lipoprotein
MKGIQTLFLTSCAVYLSACSFAPKPHRPEMPIPQKYKEGIHWVMVKPTMANKTKHCHWWMVYEDPVLNDLEVQLTRTNPTLNQAFERFQEARAMAQAARAQLYPTILGLGSGSRQGNSDTIANVYAGTQLLYNTFTMQSLLSYEVDVWGQVRNSVSAATHAARASEFDMASMDLSLHASLAEIYFQLQGENEQQEVLDKIVAAYEHALFLTHQLHIGGAVSAFEEDQAINLVEQAKTNATNMRLSRAKLQHALAILVGAIPANFTVPTFKTPRHFVVVSPELPSSLLKQRPDVAAALERVQSANATIGVARAAFFPLFTITTMLGLQTRNTRNLFSRPSLIWGLGPASGINMIPPEINQIIFDGYYLQANLKHAKASYYEAVNNYRQTVLTAYQDVEDGLVETFRLHQEINSQVAATKAAFRAVYQVTQRMTNGMDTYLNVVGPETQALQTKFMLLQLKIDGQLASVHLIRALGGGWDIHQAMKNKI